MGAGDLLRLLEPVVRPGGVPGRTRPPTRPIEDRSFEDLLAEARGPSAAAGAEAGSPGPGEDGPGEAAHAGPMARLSDVGRIENAVLRGLVGGRGGPAA